MGPAAIDSTLLQSLHSCRQGHVLLSIHVRSTWFVTLPPCVIKQPSVCRHGVSILLAKVSDRTSFIRCSGRCWGGARRRSRVIGPPRLADPWSKEGTLSALRDVPRLLGPNLSPNLRWYINEAMPGRHERLIKFKRYRRREKTLCMQVDSGGVRHTWWAENRAEMSHECDTGVYWV